MPTRCVADLENGIALPSIQYFSDDRQQAKVKTKKVGGLCIAKRAKWEPSKNSVICSVQFKPEDF